MTANEHCFSKSQTITGLSLNTSIKLNLEICYLKYTETNILKLSKSNTYSDTNSVLLLKSPGGNSFNWLLSKNLPRNKPIRLFSINIYSKVNCDLRKTKCTKAGHKKPLETNRWKKRRTCSPDQGSGATLGVLGHPN